MTLVFMNTFVNLRSIIGSFKEDIDKKLFFSLRLNNFSKVLCICSEYWSVQTRNHEAITWAGKAPQRAIRIFLQINNAYHFEHLEQDRNVLESYRNRNITHINHTCESARIQGMPIMGLLSYNSDPYCELTAYSFRPLPRSKVILKERSRFN